MTPSKASLPEGAPLSLEPAPRSRGASRDGAGFAETFESQLQQQTKSSAEAPKRKEAGTAASAPTKGEQALPVPKTTTQAAGEPAESPVQTPVEAASAPAPSMEQESEALELGTAEEEPASADPSLGEESEEKAPVAASPAPVQAQEERPSPDTAVLTETGSTEAGATQAEPELATETGEAVVAQEPEPEVSAAGSSTPPSTVVTAAVPGAPEATAPVRDAAPASTATAAPSTKVVADPAPVPAAGGKILPPAGSGEMADAEEEGEGELESAAPERSVVRPDGNRQADSRPSLEKTSESLLMAVRLGLGQRANGDAAPRAAATAFAALFGTEGGPRGAALDTTLAAPSATGFSSPLTTSVPGAAGNAASPPAMLNVSVPVMNPGWDRAMGERMVWMARQGVQEAHIQLNPRDLGPVEVRVSVHQDQASVTFTAHNAGAREALETALPRLREMMAESGFNLVQSEVSQQSPQQRQDGGQPGARVAPGRTASTGGEGTAETPSSGSEVRTGLGMVDYYA